MIPTMEAAAHSMMDWQLGVAEAKGWRTSKVLLREARRRLSLSRHVKRKKHCDYATTKVCSLQTKLNLSNQIFPAGSGNPPREDNQ